MKNINKAVLKKNIKGRFINKTNYHIKVSKKFGKEYFDGEREYVMLDTVMYD